jgi:hypothetical protein
MQNTMVNDGEVRRAVENEAGKENVLQIKDMAVILSVSESSFEKAKNGLERERGKRRYIPYIACIVT